MHIFSEGPVEITDIGKTSLLCDFTDGKICVFQFLYTAADPIIIEIFDDCHVCHIMKETSQMSFGNMKVI